MQQLRRGTGGVAQGEAAAAQSLVVWMPRQVALLLVAQVGPPPGAWEVPLWVPLQLLRSLLVERQVAPHCMPVPRQVIEAPHPQQQVELHSTPVDIPTVLRTAAEHHMGLGSLWADTSRADNTGNHAV